MAFNNRYYNNTAYSFGQGPLTDMAAVPIVSPRNPTANDTGYQLGQLWVATTSNNAYILTSVKAGLATWQLVEASGGAGVFSSLTVNPGPINLTGALTQVGTTLINTTGAAATTVGNATHGLTVAAGGLTVTAGGLTVTAGNIVATAGNISTTAGSISSHTTLTAGTGITATTGNIVSTAGNVEGVGVVASGDNAGVASTTSLTNVNALVTSGTGAFVVTPITGTATTASTGFIKLYQGTTAIYIPYWLATS